MLEARLGRSVYRMHIAHLVPLIGVGGTEAVILDLCRHRSRGHTAVVSALAPELSVMGEEIRATGAVVYAGRTAWSRAAGEADVVNLHCWGYDPAMISFLQRLGRPWVVTLHCHVRLPPLPVLTICTSALVSPNLGRILFWKT